MPSLLVIGGSGFFGKSILSAYQRGLLRPWGIEQVKIIARHATTLKLGYPALIGGSVELHDLDIAKCNNLPLADIVIHAAAATEVKKYLVQPRLELLNMQVATSNFCRLAAQSLRFSKVVYASSGAVYGKIPDTIASVSENYCAGPIERTAEGGGDYSSAKQESERAFSVLGRQGVNVSVARCFAFIGEYLPRDGRFAIGNFIEDGLNNRPIRVQAQHRVYRSYMHADDLVRWLLTIALNADDSCPIYNVGSNEAIELRELARKIADYFGQTVESSEELTELTDRYIPDISLAQRKLGLDIQIQLDEALRQTLCSIRQTRCTTT